MSKPENQILLNRREAMLMSATAGLGLALSKQVSASDSIKTGVHQQEPGNCSTPKSAVANTRYGKVRGYVDGGVFTFKGVPYGQNTGGRKSLAARQASDSLEGRVSGIDLWRELSSNSA